MAIDFTQKLGPLPVWGWGLIGGGVIGVAAFFLNRGGSATPTTPGAATLDASGYQTSGIQGGTATTDTADSTTYDNNTLWITRAAKALVDRTTGSFVDAYNALYAWTTGQTITTAQKKLVDTAVGLVGAPPEGTDGISVVTPDPTTAPTKTPTVYPLPTGTNTTKVWIKGLPGKRRGGLYTVKGNVAYFDAGSTTVPAGVTVITDEAQIAALQKIVKGLS